MADGRIVDQRWWRGLLQAVVGGMVAGIGAVAAAAGHRTANFIVEAPTPALARRIGDAAEQYRHDLAV